MDINNYPNSYNINPGNYNDNLKAANELNNIFDAILRESLSENELKFNTSELLSIYIRKNRNKINQTLKEISHFFDTEIINPDLLIQCLDGIYNSLIDKNQIINFLKLILPLLIKSLNRINVNAQNISIINKMYSYIGKYIEKGGIYIRDLVEKNIDIILEKFNTKKESKNKDEKKDNSKLISLKLLSQILKNSPILAFNKIVGKNSFDRFLNVIDVYKDSNKDIRVANGILIYHFLQMFTGRDQETKQYYLKKIYDKVYLEFSNKLKKDKDIPKDHLLLSG